jgi:hypothetical protein
MELETLTVLMAIAGATILYGAITNRNPIDVIKLTLQGEDISKARQLSSGLAGSNPFIEVVQGTPNAAPGNMHTTSGARFYPNNTPRYVDDPAVNSLPPDDPRKKFVVSGPNGHVLAAKDATRAQGGYITGADGFGNGGTPHVGQYSG